MGHMVSLKPLPSKEPLPAKESEHYANIASAQVSTPPKSKGGTEKDLRVAKPGPIKIEPEPTEANQVDPDVLGSALERHLITLGRILGEYPLWAGS